MRIVCLLLLFIFSTHNLLAADAVRVLDPANMTTLSATTNVTFSLNSVAPSGDGSSEATAGQVYIPMDVKIPTDGTANSNYFKLNAGPLPVSTYLFGFNSNVGSVDAAPKSGEVTLKNYYISFPLKITTIGQKYLHAAVKNATNYIVVGVDSNPYTNVINQSTPMNIYPQNLCRYISGVTPNCSSYDQNVSASEVAQSMVLYFFLSSSIQAVGAIATIPATTTEGLYFNLLFSSVVYSAADLTVSLDDLRKGDKRLVGTFSSSSVMANFKETLAFKHGTPICALPGPVAGCPGSFSNSAIATQQNGEFMLANLTNTVPYTISIALADNYGFVSALSNSDTETPTEIQELLKKQACYLLTAGFGEEHYVINFFRQYRDHVLAHTFIGQQFIKFYYSSAPHYALIIYQSEWMRLVIRSFAYVLYFFFNFSWLVLIFFISCFFLNLTKKRTLLRNNRL